MLQCSSSALASINNLSSEHDISKATCRVRCCDVNTGYTCCPPTDDKEDMSHYWPPRYMLTCPQLEHVHIETWDQCQCVCVLLSLCWVERRQRKKDIIRTFWIFSPTYIYSRKGHRSVLHPVLWPGSVWPVFVVSVSTVWCVAVSAWTRRRFIDCCTAAAPTKSLTWHSSTPANTATLSSQGGHNLGEVSQGLEMEKACFKCLNSMFISTRRRP